MHRRAGEFFRSPGSGNEGTRRKPKACASRGSPARAFPPGGRGLILPGSSRGFLQDSPGGPGGGTNPGLAQVI